MYVSYPTKVVFKSAKLIPTMIVYTLLNKGDKYGILDYIAAMFICLGAAGYSYSGKGSSTSETDDSMFGIALLTISVVCDALVPNLQQRLMTPKKTEGIPETTTSPQPVTGLSAQALMFNVNSIGFAFLLTFMILSGSFFRDTLPAVTNHPRLLLYLTLVGVGLSTAVLAYTKLIQCSGPVVAVTVATLRKVATFLLSYILFPKALLPIHAVSGVSVLLGVVLSSNLVKK